MKASLLKTILLPVAASLFSINASAQLSSNADKFLGNITTSGEVNYADIEYADLWNQITPENESKWQSIEGNSRGQFNWWGCDKAYDYAKKHGIPFKFHTLVWGSQYPRWMDNLSTAEQYKAIVEWMDAVKQRYPDLQMIDVVNEAIVGHAPAPYKNALGGDGVTGYDWIVKAFQMAHERWPNAILIYNDYNTFEWQKKEFIELVRAVRDAGAPIDAYGCQSHDLNDMGANQFRAAMKDLHDKLQLPMYSTEYDISKQNDDEQLQRYKEQIPVIWEAPYCAGLTLWGYVYGHTWNQAQYSGIVREDGTERLAMTWLRDYMKSDAAKQAKSPFPGMKKEASVYVRPKTIHTTAGDVLPITVDARLRTKTIQQVEVYADGQLIATLTSAPYETEYTTDQLGYHTLKAVVTATDGTQYERMGGFTAHEPRRAYNDNVVSLPGTIEAENFDQGYDGFTFHDSDQKDEGDAHYRSDNGGVDIVRGNGGCAIGYTATGEWLEYSVNVAQAGEYSYEAFASSGTTGAAFTLSVIRNGETQQLARVSVPKTADNDWGTYRALTGKCAVPLEAGRQIIRLTIDAPYSNIDRVTFNCTTPSGIQLLENADGATSSGSPLYNLQGQRIDGSRYATQGTRLPRGLYIQGGKKILVK